MKTFINFLKLNLRKNPNNLRPDIDTAVNHRINYCASIISLGLAYGI